MQTASVKASASVPASLIKTKIHPPRLRHDEVPRARTLRAFAEVSDPRVISVVAPPGYGKTTLLAQWARTKDRPVAWLTIDAADNDVVGLFTYLAAAIDRVAPLDQDLVSRFRSPGLPAYSLARMFLAALPGGTNALVVLDDIQWCDTDTLEWIAANERTVRSVLM